ncbi:MAG TPA: ABC transporter permease subunit [Candidatus Limnocylindrales bacterium]|nr:ABC transporter permease subunit [Candidatus Limnocylindrales bacterium]
MYFLKRLAFAIPLLLLISILAFSLVRVAPGGPFDRERKPASPEIERALLAKYHLDEPAWKQYARFLGDLTHGDFGLSLKYRDHSVNDIIQQALPVSACLGLLAFGFSMGVGLPLGFLASVRRGQWGDYVASFCAVLMVCTPAFVLAPLLIIWIGIKWRLLPVALWTSPLHVILPVIALGLFFAGKVSRLLREGMLETLQAPFITTARAKGASESSILLRHALRLAILPVLSYSGPLLADLLTGSFVIESIFQIPGLGTFLVNGSLNRDYTLVVGLVLLYAIILILLNLLVDLAYVLLDRRVSYA